MINILRKTTIGLSSRNENDRCTRTWPFFLFFCYELKQQRKVRQNAGSHFFYYFFPLSLFRDSSRGMVFPVQTRLLCQRRRGARMESTASCFDGKGQGWPDFFSWRAKSQNWYMRPSLFADFLFANSLIYIGKNGPKWKFFSLFIKIRGQKWWNVSTANNEGNLYLHSNF